MLRLDGLAGYRYFYLGEGLTIRDDVVLLAGTAAGTRRIRMDDFHTSNRFNGGSFGAAAFWQQDAFSAELTARADLGGLSRVVRINGSTTVLVPGQLPVVTPGGLLAQLTNAGTHGPDRFTVIPEIDLRIGWLPTHWLRLTAGYSLIVLTDAARPADQIDPRVNPNLLAGGTGVGIARPAYVPGRTDVWIQGLSFGVELFY
jgi:hypothetical protein